MSEKQRRLVEPRSFGQTPLIHRWSGLSTCRLSTELYRTDCHSTGHSTGRKSSCYCVQLGSRNCTVASKHYQETTTHAVFLLMTGTPKTSATRLFFMFWYWDFHKLLNFRRTPLSRLWPQLSVLPVLRPCRAPWVLAPVHKGLSWMTKSCCRSLGKTYPGRNGGEYGRDSRIFCCSFFLEKTRPRKDRTEPKRRNLE